MYFFISSFDARSKNSNKTFYWRLFTRDSSCFFLDLPRILRKWTLANSYTKIYIYFDSRVEFWTPTDRSLGRKCRCAVVWFWEKLKHAKSCAPIVEVKIIVYLKIMTGIQPGQPFDRPTNELTARLIVSLPIRRQKRLWEFTSM